MQETQGTNPTGGLLARWAWLGALSPVFASPVIPLLYDAARASAVRRTVIMLDRRADYALGLQQTAHDTRPARGAPAAPGLPDRPGGDRDH